MTQSVGLRENGQPTVVTAFSVVGGINMAEDINRYPTVQSWLRNVTGTSAKVYVRYFREFCEFSKLSPDDIVTIAKTDQRRIHDLAQQFFEHLARQNLSSWTCTVAYSAVRSFCKWNDVKLGAMPKKFAGHVQYESDRILRPQEVAKMIDMAPSVRNKAVVSFLHQSAQRAGVLTALRYGDVREQLERGISPIVIDIKGILLNSKGANVNKKRIRYKCAVGKETADYLKRMIEERRKHSEPINDNSWLFVSRSGAPMAVEDIMVIVKHAAEKAGIQSVRELGKDRAGRPKRKYEVHSHVFRRTWKHAMRQAGVYDADLLNFMIGHGLPYESAYDKFDVEYIRKEYAKAEPQLTVMFNREITLRLEKENLEQKFQSATGKKPEEVFPKYATLTAEQQVESLKHVPMARVASSKEVIKASREMLKDPAQHDCQRVIAEEELEAYLANGWKFVKQLQSGKIVVED